MKAVVSTTCDDKYLFFLPIITWCWNKLGVDVICFVPSRSTYSRRMNEIFLWKDRVGLRFENYCFSAPDHKQATYAQCSRLYAAALDLPEDEIIITSDIDMAVFKLPPYIDWITVFGSDLVPTGQFPICYASGKVKDWRDCMNIDNKTYQKCLDDLLGGIEAQHFKGNYWSKDQESLFIKTADVAACVNRARPGTQFAEHRVDRDDINWRSYCGPDLIDAHLWRPGYTDANFANIMELLQTQYPNENFDWVRNYRNKYIKLL